MSPDLERCEALLRHGSKSFYAASRLLPRRVREPAVALYAFCRTADDAVDDVSAKHALGAVERLRARVDRAYRGAALDSAVERAFAEVVQAFAIPRSLPDALVEGMEWDARGTSYETLDDLHAYCARVAASVGVMMTLVMGRRQPEVLARACDLGVAMQLTNIARDVGEDAARGRVYLPSSWLIEAGVDPAELRTRPRFDDRLAAVVKRTLDEAETLYTRSSAGIAALPSDCRAAIGAAKLIYRDIGRVVSRRGFDSVSQRAVVSFARKLFLVARAYFRRDRARGVEAPCLPAVRFLVRASAA